jgi:hypothetical protein
MAWEMKKLLTLIVVGGSFGVCQAQSFTVAATSQQELPLDSENYTSLDGTYAAANFTFTGNAGGGTLSTTSDGFFGYSYLPTEIDVDDAFAAGANGSGPTLFTLSVVFGDAIPNSGGLYNGLFAGSGALDAQQVTDLENGDLYLNLQSAFSQEAGQPGEVRGQINGVPDECGTMTMMLMGVGSLAWLVMQRRKV